ncbi:phage tail tape measure protein [Pseudomonas sp. NFACC45]|uniref:phage tail tape measure protein n=1 Tax=Pseudomonas sp. NFACC45 TaxID=1566201 RepID=UPI0008E80A95|nr:phage tail tape measure protein [Pseudomonas sp. NFACC45]SFH12910.1 phage tail tape measure protein, TP901 family, core region [Pseudomonas sp. NFACC45]
MSSDLRVALRIQAHSGNSRREIDQLNRDLRKAGKEGAKSLADESWKAGAAISKVGQAGATSYQVIRNSMRETAKAGSQTRLEIGKTKEELKAMADAGRKAARDIKADSASADSQGVRPLRQSVERTESAFRRLAQNGGRNLQALKAVAAGVRKEFDRIKSLGSSAQGQLAGLGVGVGAVAGLTGSARLDRQLIRTKQTANMSPEQKDDWKNEGFRIAKDYGLSRESVDSGFNTLIASGVDYEPAKKTADAIGQASTITGADSAVLGKAVVAAASAFNIDLNKGGAALDLLQKMTVAGRLGTAELEHLSDLFPKIGGVASAAGMSIEQALAFTEALSKVEQQPDRLGTLAESTLRVFSNKQYRDQITNSSGVGFFNKDGTSKNPLAVFEELKRKYSAMKTDEQRAKFMGVVFKGMDQDTVRGMRSMLTGERLDDFRSGAATLQKAEPIFKNDLKENTSSASGTATRMKATLGEAIDRMATPINKSFADMGSYLLDDLNLSGEQMLFGGAALGVGGYYAGRGAKAGAGALVNKVMGGPETLKNIAVGKVLEEATGVTSVFVTNWPGNMQPGVGMPDMPGGTSSSGKGKPGGFIAPWLAPLALGASATQLSGSTGQNTDEDRLAMVARNKLLNDGQRAYQSAFYSNRIALAGQNPNQSQDWLSSQAQRLAHQQTGLTASGNSVEGANAWAAGVANRAVGAGADTQAAVARLQQLLDKPLVIEVRSDSRMIQAEVERRTDLQVRRGQ